MSTAESFTAIGEIQKPNSLPATPTSVSRPSRISPLSSAQRVLLIREIVGIITEELPPRSLLHLGLCCQTLYRPAMDQLWRTLPSLARLLRCLPEELVEMVQCREYGHRVVSLLSFLPRPIVSYLRLRIQLRIKYVPRFYQWERVLFYARRVRVVISFRREICRETVKMLALHYPGRSMFPDLQETHLSGPSCAREISLLVSPSSQTIHYEVDLRLPHTWHINRIVEHSPDLEVLRITDSKRPAGDADTAVGVFVSPHICYVLSSTLLELENLTAVDFMAFLDPVTIQYLASLPRLARLALQLREDCVHMDLAAYTSTPFASLHSLQIRGRDTTYLTPWLSSVHLPSLKALNISTEKPPPAGISSVEELIGVVSRFQGLTYLKMRFAIIHKGLAPESILYPLLERLPSLEDFTLFGLAFNPTKISLSAMVSAWPRLRNLELHQTCYFKPSTHRIPLRDLLIFAQHCPTIER